MNSLLHILVIEPFLIKPITENFTGIVECEAHILNVNKIVNTGIISLSKHRHRALHLPKHISITFLTSANLSLKFSSSLGSCWPGCAFISHGTGNGGYVGSLTRYSRTSTPSILWFPEEEKLYWINSIHVLHNLPFTLSWSHVLLCVNRALARKVISSNRLVHSSRTYATP